MNKIVGMKLAQHARIKVVEKKNKIIAHEGSIERVVG